MIELESVKKAIAALTAEQLAEFRAWFEEFDANSFDTDIERDARTGKLDSLAERAIRDFHRQRDR